MTNETDLRDCCAQIDLVEQLIQSPLKATQEARRELLVELQTKKKLLMTFKPRSYHDILRDLESGAIIHPGVWGYEEKKVGPPKREEEPKKEIPKVKEIDQAAEIKRLKAELKKAQETKTEEVKAEIIEE